MQQSFKYVLLETYEGNHEASLAYVEYMTSAGKIYLLYTVINSSSWQLNLRCECMSTKPVYGTMFIEMDSREIKISNLFHGRQSRKKTASVTLGSFVIIHSYTQPEEGK